MDDDDDYNDHPQKKGKGKERAKIIEKESEDELSDEDRVVRTSSGNHKGPVHWSKHLKTHSPGSAQSGV